MGRYLGKESLDRAVKPIYEVEPLSSKDHLSAMKAKLDGLMKYCYRQGYSGKGITWTQAQNSIYKYVKELPDLLSVENQIGNYQRIIASKEPQSKAA